MFAIAFDLIVSETEKRHPKSTSQAYADIGKVLGSRGFAWRQGSVYTSDSEDLANLFTAIQALKALSWFPGTCATSAHSASSNGPISRM